MTVSGAPGDVLKQFKLFVVEFVSQSTYSYSVPLTWEGLCSIYQHFTSIDAQEIASLREETIMTKHRLWFMLKEGEFTSNLQALLPCHQDNNKKCTRVTSCKAIWKVLYKKPKVATDIPDLLMIGRHTLPIHHLSLFGYAISLLLLGWNWIHRKISVLFHWHEPELETVQFHSQSYGPLSWMCWMQISCFVSEQTLY